MTDKQREQVAETLRAFGLGDDDLAAWEDIRLPDEAFDDWLTDRVARRPAGARARQVYAAEDLHDFARSAILAALTLEPGDFLLEIGCGGGTLLRDALAAGARATGLDHSADMLELAMQRATAAGLVLAAAQSLPFADDTFSAIAMSIVFMFLDAPIGVLGECRRVLGRGGRLALFTISPQLRGSPAAPEPIGSRCHLYPDEELAGLARRAGLRDATVHNSGGGQLLTARV
ncbi:MAG: class I SAM-dependent methyltransferase [Streptosporangiaceae bacterium]